MVAAALALSCAASFAQSPQPTGAEQEKKLIAVLQRANKPLEIGDLSKRAGVALYNGASLLIRTKRDPARAAKMLEDYLAGRRR